MKKIPLRYIFMTIMAVILCAVAIILSIKLLTNHSFVKQYNYGNYMEGKEKTLLTLNVPESYLPYYNLGNVAYKRGDYNSAIGYYNQALNLYPMGVKDCKIRINLALSYCYSIDYYNLTSTEKIDTAIFTLYKARDILLANGCAKDGEEVGHNEDAQQLKEDIDRMIEMLKELKEQENSGSGDGDEQPQSGTDNGDGDSSADNTPSDKENRMKDKLDQNKKNALEDRKETQDDYEKWSKKDGEDGDGTSGEEGGGDGGYTRPW
jgi:tetratricopeptide (TPR) repeat protein